MKQIAEMLLARAKNNLQDMHKSKMTLTERIKYERAMVQLDTLSDILCKLQNPS